MTNGRQGSRTPANPRDLTDDDLFERARRGDGDAFGALYERYQPELCAFAASRVGDEHAEDAVHDGFARAFTALERLDDDRDHHTGSWLYRIVGNCALNMRQAERRRTHTPLDPDRHGGTAPSLHDTASSREELRVLGEAMRALPERQRLAVQARANDVSYEDVAPELETTEQGARQAAYRGRTELHRSVYGPTRSL